jgi:hypothetical protein
VTNEQAMARAAAAIPVLERDAFLKLGQRMAAQMPQEVRDAMRLQERPYDGDDPFGPVHC